MLFLFIKHFHEYFNNEILKMHDFKHILQASQQYLDPLISFYAKTVHNKIQNCHIIKYIFTILYDGLYPSVC